MTAIAGVRFHPKHLVKYVDTGGIEVMIGDLVEVETTNGTRQGTIVFRPDQLFHSNLDCPQLRILRKINRPCTQ